MSFLENILMFVEHEKPTTSNIFEKLRFIYLNYKLELINKCINLFELLL